MTQSVGWIKLHRNLRYKFSNDRKLNFELWNLYVFLIEQAPWEDTLELKKGHLRMSAVDIQSDWFPNMYTRKIIRLLNRLNDGGYINLSRYSKSKNDGYIIQICNYDSIFSENGEKMCPTSVRRVSDECPSDKTDINLISLENNDDKNSSCLSSVRRVSDECPTTGCSYYIEERKKKREGRMNTIIDEQDAHRHISDDIILDDLSEEKPKRPKKKKDVSPSKSEPVINAYKEAYFERYTVYPLIDVVVRSQACKIVDRVGADNAPKLVTFYLSHDDQFYLKKAHTLGICLSDCEKLNTEMLKDGYINKEYLDRFEKKKTGKFRI
jgi:hypothetical protein